MTSEGNVADTSILQEARQLIIDGVAPPICQGLEILMQKARLEQNTVKIQKIKTTQKAKGCRRCRRQ